MSNESGDRFKDLAEKLVKVPKEEIDRAVKKDEKKRRSRLTRKLREGQPTTSDRS
jgi:hypothetical protein